MQQPFKRTRGATKPGPALAPLPACLTERRPPHQRLARVRPAVGVRLPLVILLQPPTQTLDKLLHSLEVSTPNNCRANTLKNNST